MSRDSTPDEDFDSLLRQVARLDDQPPGPRLPRPGQIIGERFRIEERIGHGGMGAVFRASHLVSHKPVAIKWLLRSTADEHVRKRFLREARAAARVDHPNVVDVYDVGEDGEGAYLVMELLNGEPLRARLARGRLAVAEAVALLVPAMRGVAAVHQAGIVHRDIKPENIFLCRGPDGEPREAKVLDFGVSSVTARDGADSTLTGDGAVLGTLAYMSPEQLQRASDVDARTDVYSFGVVLYEALTGTLPFEADSYPGLVLAIVQSQPLPPTALRADLPVELERIVMRALAKARAERFASMDELITALASIAELPARAAQPPDLVPPARTHRRSRARDWSLALCTLLTLGAAAYWLAARSADVRPPPAPPKSLSPLPLPAPIVALEPPALAPAASSPSMPRVESPRLARKPKPVRAAIALPATHARRTPTVDSAPTEAPRSGKLSLDQL